MFEAFAGNKYRSSGIIYWMYNSAWPTLYWQLYDYFFAPNGAFYGTRKACENLHIQYAYDDGSVQVVNGNYKDFSRLKVSAKMYNMNMQEIWSKDAVTDVKADESKKVILKDLPQNTGDVYFLKLRMSDESGKEISSNFYWLSSKGDENADFTSLNSLPKVTLSFAITSLQKKDGKYTVIISVENPANSLAFSVNPKIIGATSKDLILPVFWDDNYFALLRKKRKL
jgi:exo-1,4-beta-D-glucosaminidase